MEAQTNKSQGSEQPPVSIEGETAKALRDRLLTGIDPAIIRDAWFALSHMFVPDGARIAHIACGDGAMTYAMAALRPRLNFIGLDKDRRTVNKARETHALDNLEFKTGDATDDSFKPESLDAVINSYALHEIYSHARYNEAAVKDTLNKQFKALKKEGVMFIRDYASPQDDEFALIELPDTEGTGDTPDTFSDAEFLEWYAQNARPKSDLGTGGFFLEELPQRYPSTRLFRLPYKWAYEFILRKDKRTNSQKELPLEYTYFTDREFRKELRNLGARVSYSGPYWDEPTIKRNFEGKFKLFHDNGTMLDHPPTCFVAVARKMGERKSLRIEERRPSGEAQTTLSIQAMRDIKTGRIRDVVTKQEQHCNVIPYRIDQDGSLRVYLHEGIARSIANAVPRSGENILGKRWSSHMIEAVNINLDLILDLDDITHKKTVLFARDHLGLKPANSDTTLEQGRGYYPAPDYIDEHVQTYYLNVQKGATSLTPKPTVAGTTRFQAKGKIREMDAQQVIDAITLGMIPNTQLELQLMALFAQLGITAEKWTENQIQLQISEITGNKDLAKIMKQLNAYNTRFKDVKGSAGELRAVNSIFVEEGRSRDAITGLSAQNVDFIVHDHETVNKAVVLPLTKNMREEVHAGFLLESMPVAAKRTGKSAMISCPSFELPREVTNYRLAKKFIADHFAVLPEMVIKMGEPYFCHVSLTPQKIYPFGVAVPPDYIKDPDSHFLPMHELAIIAMSQPTSNNMLAVMARSFKYLGDDTPMHAKEASMQMKKASRTYDAPEWGFPMNYERPAFLQAPAKPAAPQPDKVIEDLKVKTAAPKAEKPKIKPFHETKGDKIDITHVLDEIPEIDHNKPKPEKW